MTKATGVFADILNDLNKDSKGGGNVQFLKEGDTTLKLVMPKGRTDIRTFYQPFRATFKGEQFTYYLVAAVIIDADEEGVADPTRIRYVKVTKSIMLEIVNLLQKRWQLLDTAGPVIVVTKGKKNGKVAYSVAALPDTFDAYGLPYPEQSIEEAAEEQEARSAELDESGGRTKVEGEDLR